MFSNIAATRQNGGYSPIRAGNSFIQVATWNDAGDPVVKGILTYSQSEDPASAHYADQTRLYSRSEWIDLPFTDKEIEANLKSSIHLSVVK
jgi:acyl-homoserine-lactone acylase